MMQFRSFIRLASICMLAMHATAFGQGLGLAPTPATSSGAAGPGLYDVSRSPVLDRYRGSTALPDFPTVGTITNYGLPDRGYFPLRGQSWVQLDYLLWFVPGQHIPPLAATAAGDVLLCQNSIDDDAVSGLRLRAGHYFDCNGLCGVMVDFWGLDSAGHSVSATRSPGGSLYMPFIDMDFSLPSNIGPDGCACFGEVPGTPSRVPIQSISTSSDSDIWSGGVYYRSRIAGAFDCCSCDACCGGGLCRNGHRLDWILGYRYLDFDESLGISGVFTPDTGRIVARDRFDTDNDFHGVDFGWIYEHDRGRWSLELLTKLALGINRQELRINGAGNQGGGIFAQYTNIGTYEHDAFTVIPEVNLTAAYAITPRFRARIGYSVLWLSNVIRPGTQVDNRLDGRFFDATQTRPFNNPLAFYPLPKFETESVWLHGLTFGFDYSF